MHAAPIMSLHYLNCKNKYPTNFCRPLQICC